jgi:hypothetical protein
MVADLVFCNWPALLSWGSISYERTVLGLDLTSRPNAELAAAERVLRAAPGLSLTESAIITAIASVRGSSKRNEIPLLAKAGRRLRVAVADRLRREQLVTWPAVLAAAVNDWTVPTLQRLVQHHAAAGDAAIHYVMRLEEAKAAAAVAATQAEDGAAAGPRRLHLVPTSDRESGDSQPGGVAGHDDSETEAAESLVRDAVVEIEHWRSQRDRVQADRDRLADRDARSRSRIESLEQELLAAREAMRVVERTLLSVRAERDVLAQRAAVEEALVPDAPPPAVDTFAGRRVLFLTGVEAADARAALAQGFWDLGAAQVDCYWTDKVRGPDVFPADAIVAVDVTFMGHSAWNTIQDRARGAGAWCYTGKHGAATMARATAAAWGVHLARAGG